MSGFIPPGGSHDPSCEFLCKSPKGCIAEHSCSVCDAAKTKHRDQLAKGPKPLERVEPPKPGERCPRCHAPKNGMRSKPCLLCNPDDVPPEFK